jgi:hypothetical protein
MCAMDMRITEADLTGLITLGHILVLKKWAVFLSSVFNSLRSPGVSEHMRSVLWWQNSLLLLSVASFITELFVGLNLTK